MATLQQQIAELDAKIAAGTRSVTDSDQTVTLNTTDSLIRARQFLQDQINAQAGTRRLRMTYTHQTGRGLNDD